MVFPLNDKIEQFSTRQHSLISSGPVSAPLHLDDGVSLGNITLWSPHFEVPWTLPVFLRFWNIDNINHINIGLLDLS